MALGTKKGAMEFSAIIGILLIVIAAGIIIGALTLAAGKADEKTAENLCRGFNALRFGTKIERGGVSLNIAPRACKTVDKENIPTKDYPGPVKEASSAQIRDLMARCWWMWLEGHQQNMFDVGPFALDNKCFICYTFSLKKEAGGFGYDEFSASLAKPYYAVDSSDRCAPAGQGGKCRSNCESGEKEVLSGKCSKADIASEVELKCCSTDDECENKGGKCLDGPNVEFSEYYPQWKCRGNACYIRKNNLATYLDYIQGTGGVSGGAGKVLFADNSNFQVGKKYAITFVSPGNDWDVNSLLLLGGTGTMGVATLYTAGGAVAGGIATGGVLPIAAGALWAVKYLIVGGAATAAAAELTSNTGSPSDLNYIMISEFDTVKAKCAIEAGAGE